MDDSIREAFSKVVITDPNNQKRGLNGGTLNRGIINICLVSKFVRSVLDEKPTGREDLFLLIFLSLQEGYNMKKFIDSSSSQILHNAVRNFKLVFTLKGMSAEMQKTILSASRSRLIAPELTVKALSDETLKRPLPYKTVELAFGLKDGLSYPKILCNISVASLFPVYPDEDSPGEFIYSSLMCIFGYALIEIVASELKSSHEEVKKIVHFLMLTWKSIHISPLRRKQAFTTTFRSLNQAELQEIAGSIEQYCNKNNFDSPSVEIKVNLGMQRPNFFPAGPCVKIDRPHLKIPKINRPPQYSRLDSTFILQILDVNL